MNMVDWYITELKRKLKNIKLVIWYISETLKCPHGSVFEWNGRIVNRITYIYHTVKLVWNVTKGGI